MIAPSKLGLFVVREGFSWPASRLAVPREFGTADETLVRRLRETGLVRPDTTDGEVAETFRAARSDATTPTIARAVSTTSWCSCTP